VRGWGVVAGAAKPYMMRDAPDGQPDGDDATPATRGAHGRTAGHRHTSISGDVRADWSEAFALVPSLQVGYVWYASAHTQEVLAGLLEIGFELAQQIIWDKGLFSIGRSGTTGPTSPASWSVSRGTQPLHRRATTRPRSGAPLHRSGSARAPRRRSRTTRPEARGPVRDPDPQPPAPGEAVYEPFSGSGTTLIAAETLGRRCYAMEIDPKYVQLAIERWQNFTGRTAERLDG